MCELRAPACGTVGHTKKPRRKALAAVSASVSLIGAALLGGAPTASAESIHLDNGYTVDLGPIGADGSRRIFVTADNDTDDFIVVRSTGREKFDRDLEKRVASFIVNRDQRDISIAPCTNGGLYSDICGPQSGFPAYETAPPPPPVVQAPDPPPPPPPPPPPQDPAPAPVEKKPLEGPTVSASGGFGGVTLTFTDRSAVAGQCTYKSDVDEKTFPLRANSSADIDVQGRRSGEDSRPGTVTCNNGTSADANIDF